MSKFRYLIKNTGILAIGSFSSKVLVFLLVPIYTSVLSEDEYGSYDLILSTINLLIPVLTLNIADAALRFPMDKGANLGSIAKAGLLIIATSAVIVFAVQPLICLVTWLQLPGIQLSPFFYLSLALYQFLITLSRGMERMKQIAIAGVVSSFLIFILTVLLLLQFHAGLEGFFIANIIGYFAPSIYLLFILRKTIFAKGGIDFGLTKRMIKYSLPLAMTIIGWWLINSSGRYVVTIFCGLAVNGLFSIAYKIPAIFNSIVGIFLQAWQVSAVKEFDREDKDGFLSTTYYRTEALLAFSCSVLIALTPLICSILFADSFYQAWKYVPLLLIGAFASSMAGVLGPFFTANYVTGPLVVSTGVSGAVCVVSSLILVHFMGAQGVAFGSMLACIANWLWRLREAKRRTNIDFKVRRSVFVYFALIVQSLVLLIPLSPLVTCSMQVIIVLVILLPFISMSRKRNVGK